jgi:hypothetical protein
VLAAAAKDHCLPIMNAVVDRAMITAFFRRWRPRHRSRQVIASLA